MSTYIRQRPTLMRPTRSAEIEAPMRRQLGTGSAFRGRLGEKPAAAAILGPIRTAPPSDSPGIANALPLAMALARTPTASARPNHSGARRRAATPADPIRRRRRGTVSDADAWGFFQ